MISRVQQHPRLFPDVFKGARQGHEKVLSRETEIDRKRRATASDQSVSCSSCSEYVSDRRKFGEAVDEQLCVMVLQGNQEMSEPVT